VEEFDQYSSVFISPGLIPSAYPPSRTTPSDIWRTNAMRSKQELERVLDQYDLDHAKRGGLAGAARKLYKKAGAKGLAAFEIVNRLFSDLPAGERATLSDILNRDLAGDGRGWLRVLVAGGDIPHRLRLAKKSIWQMQGRKLLEIEGAPKLAMFELRDGRYWDGEPVAKYGTTTPAPDGFYVCELRDDRRIAQADTGGDLLFGPYATAAEAERTMRDALKGTGRAYVTLERAGLISRETSAGGVTQFQRVALSPEEEEKAWKRIESEHSEEERAIMLRLIHQLRGEPVSVN
jgi:hypothetical protein